MGSNGTMFTNSSNVEVARFDTSGRLLVNTSSSFNDGSTIQLAGSDSHLGFKYTGTTGGNEQQIRWFDKRDQANAVIANNLTNDNSGAQAAHLVFKTSTSGTLSERMRILDSGPVCINRASQRNAEKFSVDNAGQVAIFTCTATADHSNIQMIHGFAQASNNATQIAFKNSNATTVGSIKSTASATSFNTSSDYRLKENVVDLDGAITRVKQLSPKRFNFIIDADTTVDGFLAHEAQTVVPEAVTGTHNALEVWKEGEELPEGVSVGDNKLDDDGNTIPDYQGIDQSKLVPLLTAALQEAIAKIETLETKVAALEAS